MVEVGEEDLGVGGRLDGHGGDHAADAHRAQDGEYLPVAFRRGFMDPDAARRSRVAACHLGRDAAFVKEDHLLRRNRPQPLDEELAPPQVLFRVPFGGVERLFFSRKPSSRTTRHIWV
jgi:hypothetical protein